MLHDTHKNFSCFYSLGKNISVSFLGIYSKVIVKSTRYVFLFMLFTGLGLQSGDSFYCRFTMSNYIHILNVYLEDENL